MKPFLTACLLMPAVLCAHAAKESQAVALPVAPVAQVEDFQTRTYPGKLVAVAQVNIVSRVNGEILEMGFQNGDIVKAGQVLYKLDSVKYEAIVKNAEAKIAEYKARSAYAESNYKRNQQLSEANAVSQDTLENTLSARNAYQATLAAAEADLISAKDDLAHCQITAPIGGKVGTSNFTAGNYVTTNSGTLVTLIQTSPIRVRFSMSLRDYLDMFGGKSHHIRANGIVKLTLADGKTFAEDGSIEYVDNAADDNTDTIQVFAMFTNTDRVLKPGGTVGVTLQSKAGVKKAAVPPSAILQDIRGSFVWVVGSDNIVHKRYVIRGDITDQYQILESGVNPGETVVIDGTHKVLDGDKIAPVDQAR